jgi:hypothetical protein
MTRNLEPGLEPQAHVRVRMYRYSGATGYSGATLPLLFFLKPMSSHTLGSLAI